MAFIGDSPSVKRTRYTPQSVDPVSPQEGDVFYSDGTPRPEGIWVYKDGSWQQEGGSGASGRLYFTDVDATNLAKASLYADAAAATPVDGTGGSPNITKALNTSTPLIGTSSYRVSKDAADRQGEGVAFETDIALDAPVKAGEAITVQFRYRTSANYASGDIKMFYYLVGDNTLYALNGMDSLGNYTNDLNAETGDRGQFTASLNATSATTSIRVIAHIATTNALAYDVDFDEITIGTAAQLVSVEKREVILSAAGSGNFTGGTVRVAKTGNIVSVSVQDSLTHPSSAVPVSASGFIPVWARPTTEKRNQYQGTNEFYVTSAGLLGFARVAAATSSGTTPNVSYSVDETGSNIVSTTQAAFQTAKFRASKSSAQTISAASPTKITWQTIGTDNFGAFDTVNNRYVVRGKRFLNISASLSTSSLLQEAMIIAIYKNGSEFASNRAQPGGTNATFTINFQDQFEDGDFIEIFLTSSTDTSYNVDNNTRTFFSISEVPDLSVVGLAGQRRERLEVILATTQTYNTTTETDVSGMSLSLTPGVWRVGYKAVSLLRNQTAGVAFVTHTLRLTNSSNTLIPGTISQMDSSLTASFDLQQNSSAVAQITLTSADTVKLRATGDGDANNVVSLIGLDRVVLYAERIA